MAPYIPVPDTLQANLRYTCAGQRLENVLNFSYEGLGFGPACIAVVDVINTELWPNIRTSMTNQLQFVEIYMVDLASSSGETRTGTPGIPSAGSVDSPPAPLNVSFCVSHRTAQRGRSFRGRTYIGGLAYNVIQSQQLAAGNAGTILAAFQLMRDAAAAAGAPFVIVSRYSGNLPRAVGVSTPVTSILLQDTIVDSQRRRLPGRGS